MWMRTRKGQDEKLPLQVLTIAVKMKEKLEVLTLARPDRSLVKCHSHTPRLCVGLWSGHVKEAINECMNGWNSK